ncbi:glycoside hydrolase family 2 protein [bacterium]|uniref:glycoside hydrolase family 2 protein n=1 Tax=Gemmiger sp. TaxID=2049027 RepID=UPI002A7F7615|nr:glycoside hydrolase family 2 TIM barrel-domain containing protein [Gemmiger sp.]MCI5555986.1 glycoside hydrolase family 2 protein [bacterium]MCI6084380.1 glycoside hydrolase family 2 protein [bacterium]MCI6247951.1 glycoside hydrolase family 2 protein [bacterium]MCI6521463.1 glycoside hydrolase family 2 protein [bacterium]MCI6884201.1 glycoside hydrolase family 2 protein [bacterium]
MRNSVRLTEALFAKDGDAFTKVALPHTWNNIDGQDGMADGPYWRGLGCYHLELPNPTEGKKQYIEFQGANHVATVYCNGREMGCHKGGFSTFRFDLTPAMKPADNILTVEVTNAVSDIYPQNADFTFYGGLYRAVNFIEVTPAHFDLLKDGTSGVFVTPRANGMTRVDLFPVGAEGCTVKVALKDAEGNVVAQSAADAAAHTVIKIKVKEPHLWNSMEDPYCYTCEATIEKDGAVLDAVTETYGYRSFHVDPDKGFFLNGKSYPLHGVSRHQDRQDMGWAITPKEHEEDIALIKEVGANTIRLAHYQHDQYFYSLCDHTGFVLWAEIPFISQFIPTQEAHDNTISQMTELIAQNYNHPSIFFWGISNEITIAGESEALYQNLTELNALAKKLDPSRLTTMAQVSMVPMDSEHTYITDLQSYNHYFGWYVGDVEDNGPWLDKFHALNPDRCLGVSEYGAENILKWHTAYPDNHDYTEEYASHYHHEMLKTFATRPYLWATHVWNMFDFAADARDEGGVQGRNNKGLVTYDRKTKKDAFYIYQAYWTTKPMVHVCGERFVDRAPDERFIDVYTNCDEVTLYVNGEAVATKAAVDHEVLFENVALRDGDNVITARSGDVEGNTITVRPVAEHNYAYDVPEGNQGANWFDDPAAVAARKAMKFPAGYYSIKDKVSVLMANPETAKVLQGAMAQILGGTSFSMMNDAEKSDKSDDNPMAGFYGMMRLSDLMKMAGKSVTAEMKQQINDALIQIKK